MVNTIRGIPPVDDGKPEFGITKTNSGQHRLTVTHGEQSIVVPIDSEARTWLMDELRKISTTSTEYVGQRPTPVAV